MVPEQTLGERALEPARQRIRWSQRLPQRCRGGSAPHAQQRDGTGVVGSVVQAVHGLVGEQGAVRIAPAGGEPGRRRQEHPQVRVGRDVHQEWRERIHGGDVLPGLAVQFEEGALGHPAAHRTWLVEVAVGPGLRRLQHARIVHQRVPVSSRVIRAPRRGRRARVRGLPAGRSRRPARRGCHRRHARPSGTHGPRRRPLRPRASARAGPRGPTP